MKVLLPIDGSRHSIVTINEFLRRPWPAGTHVEVFSVAVPSPTPHTVRIGQTQHFESLEMELTYARRDVDEAAAKIRQSAPALQVSTNVLAGSPADIILQEAAAWGANLILMGYHGRPAVLRLLVGSVATTVSKHAPCPVEIVRTPEITAAA